MSTPQIPEQISALAVQAPGFLAKVCIVENGDDMKLAMGELSLIKTNLKVFKPARENFLSPARENLKRYEEMFDLAAGPAITQLTQAKTEWETKILDYNRRETERAAREQAERDAQIKAEQDAATARAKAIEAKARLEAKRTLESAQALEAEGNAADAAELYAQAESVQTEAAQHASDIQMTAAMQTAAPVEVDLPKTGAGHFTTTWSGVCDKIDDLIVAVAEGIKNGTNHPSSSLLKIDQVALNNTAKVGKEKFRVPGCRAVPKQGITSRSR